MENLKTIYMAGGCFWGTERAFQLLDGVVDTNVGYVNGCTENPTYQEVCSNTTGFKEAVKIIYDPSVIALETLLKAFFLCIHPEQRNRQGNDIGSQYQTGVYYTDEESRVICEAYFEVERLKHSFFFTELAKLENYYDAESYHQDYLLKNPMGYCHVSKHEFDQVKALNTKNKMAYLKAFNLEDIDKEYFAFKNIPADENGFSNRYHGIDYSSFIHQAVPYLINQAKGIQLTENHVPETYYFLWKGDEVIGLFKLRHYLNEHLRNGSGHVGYTILPHYRHQGYAKKGLCLLIEEAKKIILEDELYLSAYRSNPASIRVQLANGAYIHHEDDEKVYTRITLRK